MRRRSLAGFLVLLLVGLVIVPASRGQSGAGRRALPLILELGGHLLKPEGRLLAMKGVVPEDEIAALPAGWRVAAVHPLRVPGLDAERHLLEVVKSPG